MLNNYKKMEERRKRKISGFLSLVLRHKPEVINLNLDNCGWADVKELIKKSTTPFDFNELKYIVQNCDKQRFSFSEDSCKIRANQGHSIKVDIKFKEIEPPDTLYHGTPWKSVSIILKEGLSKMKRNYVHLSGNVETANKVGKRRGDATIFEINAKKMYEDGYKIYISENGVYLTNSVPKEYIKLLS